MTLEQLYSILNEVLPNKVFYGKNVYDNNDNASMPYIVYQEINKRAIGYHDDKPIKFSDSIQIMLVTKSKDKTLETSLETKLLQNNLNYALLSEYLNDDKSVNRVYEIKIMEEN